MADMKQIHEFAVKWYDKFMDKKINYIELVDHYMADDCEARLGCQKHINAIVLFIYCQKYIPQIGFLLVSNSLFWGYIYAVLAFCADFSCLLE